MFQMGLIWGTDVTNLHQTNSIHARNDLSSGDGIYWVGERDGGYLSFYNGGANKQRKSRY